jgi:cysteine desulfurase
MRIYLDNAATTPLDPEVLKEMYRVMESHFGNPSSIHAHGREARTVIEKARKVVAGILNTGPAQIFFTSGGTEADNMAIRCGMGDHKLKHAITSRIEHHAVLHTLEAMQRSGLIELSFVDIDGKGNVSLEHLEQLLSTSPRSFVSLMHANNEIGTLIDIGAVGAICRRHHAIFHCDTVQTMGHYPIDLQQLPVDFIACAAHKFHGPKGVGFIYVNPDLKINPMIFGGAQERNMRGGTENLYGIAGLAKALEMASAEMAAHHRHIQGLKTYMIDQLRAHISGVGFNGEIDPGKSLYTVLNVLLPETDLADMLLFNLDISGISVSGGSACSSGTNIGSHVLEGIGSDPNRPAVRFSFSKLNTKDEIDFVIAKLKSLF